MILILWRDISHSREDKRDHLQSKGNVENGKTSDIFDFSLCVRKGI